MKGPPESKTAAAATVLPAAVASGSLIAQHVAGKATRDTLFLDQFGLSLLPAAMIGAALVSSVAVILISRTLARHGPARVVPAMFGLSAIAFLLEWWLSTRSIHAAAIAVYVHTAIFGSAGVSAFWSLVNERFDPQTAKRVVGRIASGGTVGGVAGGLLVWRTAAHLSVSMMLALLAGMNVIGLWGALRTVPRGPRSAKSEEPYPGGGSRALKETPYLRDLALLVAAGAVLQALLDWLLSAHASHEFKKGELLAFFALFNMIVGVASFAAQTVLARPVLEKRGLAGTVQLQPVGVLIGAVVALLNPVLTTVVFLRWTEATIRNSLYRSAYELFYTPLPQAKKRATKTLVDVGFDRIGTTIGSIALLGIAPLALGSATRIVLVASIAMAAISFYLASRLHEGYVATLAESLKTGSVALDNDDAFDLTTKKTLAETTALLDREKLLASIEQFQKDKRALGVTGPRPELSSPKVSEPARPIEELANEDPLVLRIAAFRSSETPRIKAELMTPIGAPLAPFVVPLLSNDAVVREAVRSLRKIAPRITGHLLDVLLDPEGDPRVRRRIPRVMKVVRTQRAASGLVMALKDPVFDVRVQVALALQQMREEADVTFDKEAIFDVVLHEITSGRATWGQPQTSPEHPSSDGGNPSSRLSGLPSAPPPSSSSSTGDDLHRGLAHVFTVLGLVLDREPLAIAYRALRSEEAGLKGTAYEYLEVVLPPRLRDAIVPMLGDVKPARGGRAPSELAEELLRSNAAIPKPSIKKPSSRL